MCNHFLRSVPLSHLLLGIGAPLMLNKIPSSGNESLLMHPRLCPGAPVAGEWGDKTSSCYISSIFPVAHHVFLYPFAIISPIQHLCLGIQLFSCIARISSTPIGLVPPGFFARLSRKGTTLEDVEGWTFDKINIQRCQTSRPTRTRYQLCKRLAGALLCTVPPASRRIWPQASF